MDAPWILPNQGFSVTDRRTTFFERMATLDGAEERQSRWSDRPAVYLEGNEVAHFEGSSGVDVRLTRAEIRRLALKDKPGCYLRESSDWVTIDVDEADDETLESALNTLATVGE